MTDTDKKMAKAWAENEQKWSRGHFAQAAARYILSTLADDRDARIEALKDQLRAEEDDHRADVERLTKERDEALRAAGLPRADIGQSASWCNYLSIGYCNKCGRMHDGSPSQAFAELGKLPKRECKAVDVAEKPAAEDAELDTRVQKLGNLVRGTGAWFDAVECAIELLAARVKEMRR